MRVVIVGSVAAGTSAGTKIRRNDPQAEIVIYERDSVISYSGCGLPYFVGGEVDDMSELAPRGPDWFAERYRIDVRVRHDVTHVDAARRRVTVTDLGTGAELTDTYDVLILATGASPVRPELAGIDATGIFPMRTPSDAEAIRAHLRTGVSDAVVLGAGYIGLEMVEQLRGLGVRTTLVEREAQVMPALDADVTEPIVHSLRDHGVDLRLGQTAAGFEGDPVTGVRLGSGELLPAQLVVVALGIRPNTALAEEAGVRLGESGAIAVDEHMATDVPGIFAVGDVAESFDVITGRPLWRALGTTANKMGRIAGDSVSGGTLAHRGIVGTGIFRVFDLAVAQTGLTERAARSQGFEVVATITRKPDRSEYLGGRDMLLKTVADRSDGRVLGAQIVGPQGVDKRIDVLATAITFGARAEDLFHLDLAYAPPFSDAKDPIHYAGMALTNALHRAATTTADAAGSSQ